MPKNKLTAEQETEIINENKKKPENQKKHKFKPAEWTHPNGDEERTGGYCEPEVNKEDAPVTTQTVGTRNPVHRRRRSQLRLYLKGMVKSITKREDQQEMLLNKADELREFIEESVYSRKFQGVSKSMSELIKEFIIRAITKGYDKARVMKYLERKGIDKKQAGMIFRQETHELRNKVREWSYRKLDDFDEIKFKWIGPGDHRRTKTCENISKRTRDGVSMDQLKTIINEEVENAKTREELPDNYSQREFTPHFGCRHTFVRL